MKELRVLILMIGVVCAVALLAGRRSKHETGTDAYCAMHGYECGPVVYELAADGCSNNRRVSDICGNCPHDETCVDHHCVPEFLTLIDPHQIDNGMSFKWSVSTDMAGAGPAPSVTCNEGGIYAELEALFDPTEVSSLAGQNKFILSATSDSKVQLSTVDGTMLYQGSTTAGCTATADCAADLTSSSVQIEPGLTLNSLDPTKYPGSLTVAATLGCSTIAQATNDMSASAPSDMSVSAQRDMTVVVHTCAVEYQSPADNGSNSICDSLTPCCSGLICGSVIQRGSRCLKPPAGCCSNGNACSSSGSICAGGTTAVCCSQGCQGSPTSTCCGTGGAVCQSDTDCCPGQHCKLTLFGLPACM
jgi:hypothetical protein